MSADENLVLVVGAGTLGAGITQNLLTAGASVTLVDVQPAALKRGVERIRDALAHQ